MQAVTLENIWWLHANGTRPFAYCPGSTGWPHLRPFQYVQSLTGVPPQDYDLRCNDCGGLIALFYLLV